MKKKELTFSLESQTLDLIKKIETFLAGAHVQSYLVGGLIRDGFLGRKTADIDIAVKADALEITRKFAEESGGSFVLLDEVNRIGRVVLPEGKETVDFSSIEGEIYDDLSRRDFTIDAMAFPLSELALDSKLARLVDPFGGRNDLRDGIVRMVGRTVFTDDPVRLLRAVRLAFELGFAIERNTEAEISRSARLVGQVSGERIREELLRILDIPKETVLPYLDRLGLLTAVIPELEETKGVTQPREHHWKVFEHSLESVAVVDFLLHRGGWKYAGKHVLTSVPWDKDLEKHFEKEVSSGSKRRQMLKLAALLHDIAKPQTKAPDVTGRIRFLGHGNEGAETVAGILDRLRFSVKEIRLVTIMVKYHMRPAQMRNDAEPPTQRAIYRYFRDTEGAGIDILFLNLADHLAARGPSLDIERWREHAGLVSYLLSEYRKQQELVQEERLITGDDLIKTFGMKPGPRVGRILEKVHEAQAAGEISKKKEALDYARNLLHTLALSEKDINSEV